MRQFHLEQLVNNLVVEKKKFMAKIARDNLISRTQEKETRLKMQTITKKRRLSNERTKRSWVWEYFDIHADNSSNEKDIQWVKCKIANCNSKIKVKKFNTSNMIYHLNHSHQIHNKGKGKFKLLCFFYLFLRGRKKQLRRGKN
jgi:hypothetical protein